MLMKNRSIFEVDMRFISNEKQIDTSIKDIIWQGYKKNKTHMYNKKENVIYGTQFS